jgi:hypothetical protein
MTKFPRNYVNGRWAETGRTFARDSGDHNEATN